MVFRICFPVNQHNNQYTKSAGSEKMAEIICEITVNQRNINTIEVPELPVVVAPGDTLVLRFVNQGASIHVTARSIAAARFTLFVQENIFVPKQTDYPLPIKESSIDGTFSIEIITGYGATADIFTVEVVTPEPVFEYVEDEIEPSGKEVILTPFPWPQAVLLLIAGIAFGAWLIYPDPALCVLAFVVPVIGVVLGWYYRQ